MFAMPEAEPVRWLPRLCESERRALPALVKLADMIFDPSTLPRRRRHAIGKLDRFVTHSGLIGPTRAGWSFGCLLMTVELTSRPTRLNCN
ncbi:hypothetical protein CK226_09965 [Mesorhizobium sp. WSM4311]|nr:hypothetical protein CK226_09965 [Mesorhizobium sp. WSM4311]TRD06812.1 hypothetical protein FJV82_08765 [Mesorhizobium sp. WSM4305]